LGDAAFRQAVAVLPNVSIATHPYLAPELRGAERFASRRADLYSVGGVLFWLATGFDPEIELPHNNDELKRKIYEQIEAKNPDLLIQNCAIADVVARCLRYDRPTRR
jgi:serine/threonine protein kinase